MMRVAMTRRAIHNLPANTIKDACMGATFGQDVGYVLCDEIFLHGLNQRCSSGRIQVSRTTLRFFCQSALHVKKIIWNLFGTQQPKKKVLLANTNIWPCTHTMCMSQNNNNDWCMEENIQINK
jgi:hypothetical protein